VAGPVDLEGELPPTCLPPLGEVHTGKHRAGTGGEPFLEITLATTPRGNHVGDTLTGLAVPEGRDVALTDCATQNGLRFFT
jgi:hypothetical protein